LGHKEASQRHCEIIHSRSKLMRRHDDGRPLRRYSRRWKIQRLVAWPGNFRRLVAPYERHALSKFGFVWLGYLLILLH
jgi:hypothetical protein